ncbi:MULTISPECIES: hypothetical protein [Pseudomonas]|uniref:Uncharacterized protein n=1 Tax=Pseudomonas tritici TaxID=2745518 RepID=A0A8H9YUP1_9PSED|nr:MULTISPECIES: hypothetical protein [Pseudomonas]MBP2870469.1 hypothetical protein [Pseudomonas sp. SWRI144]QXH85041.1 hypothetical protein HU722_0006105 [Pseudomonas tritici]CRM50659.1 hypothetical protein [Pseudomonas sp. 35 E 8]CRM58708.1 hypothetical protein [Pseudomonas sp. 52 E 6]
MFYDRIKYPRPCTDAFVSLASTPAPAVLGTPNQVPKQEVSSNGLPRMQNLGLTNLRQTLMQGISNRVNSQFSTALHVKDDSNKGKVAGVAITVAGAAMQGGGARVATNGGAGAKVFGGAMVWGGRTMEEYGKKKYDIAGTSTNNTGNYNAYSPSNWGGRA